MPDNLFSESKIPENLIASEVGTLLSKGEDEWVSIIKTYWISDSVMGLISLGKISDSPSDAESLESLSTIFPRKANSSTESTDDLKSGCLG